MAVALRIWLGDSSMLGASVIYKHKHTHTHTHTETHPHTFTVITRFSCMFKHSSCARRALRHSSGSSNIPKPETNQKLQISLKTRDRRPFAAPSDQENVGTSSLAI